MSQLPLEEDTSLPFDESSPPSTPSTKEVKVVGTPATQTSDRSSGADDVDLERNDSLRKVLFEDDKKEEAQPKVKGTSAKRMYILLALIFVVIAVVVPVVIVFTGKDDEANTSRSIVAPTEPTTPTQPMSPATPAEPNSPAEPTTPAPAQPNSPAETIRTNSPAETIQPTSPDIAQTNPPSASTNPPTTPVPTTISPTPAPTTSSPTPAPTTNSPTPAPTTSSPTPAPTVDRLVPLVSFLAGQTGSTISEDPTSPVNLALQFLVEQDDVITFNEKLVQRFALLSMDYALSPSEPGATALSWSIPNVDECSWNGVLCDGDVVTKLLFGGRNLEGEIPSEISMLSGLKHLDMANNKLSGSLPEELYGLTMLEAIYLYKNELSGSLTNSIGRLENLIYLCLNDNSFIGDLPTAWKSTAIIRPLHWLNLYNNSFTGPIPNDLRWRQMFYFDVGYNQLTGQLPNDLGEEFARLRHLHLDHNRFTGTLPTSYIVVGNGRLESLTVDNNQLGGAVPSNFEFLNKLVYYTLDNNNFSSGLNKNICKLSVFDSGENIEFQADCDTGICKTCGGIMCRNCVGE